VKHPFSQVDVFASGGFAGNPVAVVHDAVDADGTEIDTARMHEITSWTNLSEATFLLPPTDPGADYRVRIFCPGRELPFAGHPTLGSCAAWLAAGGTPRDPDRIVQECGAGLVPIRREGERLAFAAPPLLRSGPVDDDLLHDRLDALGLQRDDVVEAAWIDNGPGWMGLLMHSAAAVLDVALPTGPQPGFDVGLVGLLPPGGECAIEVRGLFADATGMVREDPVTGSLNASVAQWLLASGRLAAPYVARQGTVLGRGGRIFVDVGGDDAESDAGAVWVGGHTTVSVRGTITIA
jgi:PhzF family phenazine biosynthesis protein